MNIRENEKRIVLLSRQDFFTTDEGELRLNTTDQILILFYSNSCQYTDGAMKDFHRISSEDNPPLRMGLCEVSGNHQFFRQSSLNLEATPTFVIFADEKIVYKNILPPTFGNNSSIPKKPLLSGEAKYCTLDSAYSKKI
jgi:hypothetical protein